MTVLKNKDVVNGLTKKGFEVSQGDHRFFVFYADGKKTSIRTKVSHGSKEVNDSLIGIMSYQLKLDKKMFVDLIQCPLSKEAYVAELKKQGFIL